MLGEGWSPQAADAGLGVGLWDDRLAKQMWKRGSFPGEGATCKDWEGEAGTGESGSWRKPQVGE